MFKYRFEFEKSMGLVSTSGDKIHLCLGFFYLQTKMLRRWGTKDDGPSYLLKLPIVLSF